MAFFLVRQMFVLAILAVRSVDSFLLLNRHRHRPNALSFATNTRETKPWDAGSKRLANNKNNNGDPRRTIVASNNHRGRGTPGLFLSGSSNDYNNDYNDDAFGFVFLGGYVLTRDVFFSGTFLVLSAVAAIGTRAGRLPSTRAVPASVAGATLVVLSLLHPFYEPLCDLLPFVERPESSVLPLDPSTIQLGLCTVSMLYGFVLSSSEEEEPLS